MEQHTEYRDEISLIDIVLILKKRKALFWGVLVLFTLLAGVLSYLKSSHYQFNQNVKLAHYYSKGEVQPVVSLGETVADLHSNAIPATVTTFNNQHTMQFSNKMFTVSPAKGLASGNSAASKYLFSISVKGKKSLKPYISNIMTDILHLEQINQHKALDNFKQLTLSQQQINQDDVMTTTHSLTLLKSQIKKLATLNKSNEARFTQATDSSILTLAHDQLISSYQQLINYQQQLQKNLPQLKISVAEHKLILSSLAPISAVSTVTMSSQTVGLTKLSVFGVVLIMGFILAMVTVFLAEFWQQIKERSQE